jgi:hypothetical protein
MYETDMIKSEFHTPKLKDYNNRMKHRTIIPSTLILLVFCINLLSCNTNDGKSSPN